MNNLVTLENNELVTTSLAIAEGVENPHASVIRLIRENKSDLEEFGPLGFQIHKGQPLPQGGFAKSTEIATLNQEQATLLLTYMRNNDVVRSFKKQLVKAFYELAKAKQPNITLALSDPAILRATLLEYSEKVLSLEAANEVLKPKAEFHDAVSEAVNCQTVNEVAKAIGTGEKRLFQFLRATQMLMTDNAPYQKYIEAGYFKVVEKKKTISRTAFDANGHRYNESEVRIYNQTLVTGKGLIYIQKKFNDANPVGPVVNI